MLKFGLAFVKILMKEVQGYFRHPILASEKVTQTTLSELQQLRKSVTVKFFYVLFAVGKIGNLVICNS